MGPNKFRITCAGYGIEVSETEAQRIVDLYRQTYFNVKNYWYDMERTMLDAYRNPGQVKACMGIMWLYKSDRKAMFCRLPSGRYLTYWYPELKENKFDNMGMTFMTEVTGQWVRRETYGGLLVENITQATARDIMAYSIPRLEKAGFPILIHVHDELVSERPIGEDRISEMVDIMCKVPEWGKGLPIVAEGFKTDRYRKG
jgi:DNA polymerase